LKPHIYIIQIDYCHHTSFDSLGSHPSNRKHNENDAKETYQIINQSYTQYLTMVVENLSF